MSTQHHGSNKEQSDLIERFQEQTTRDYRRRFPDGRIGSDDDGDLTYALTTDTKHGVIVMRFAHPTEWIGLDRKAAEQLRDALDERLLELRGISAIS